MNIKQIISVGVAAVAMCGAAFAAGTVSNVKARQRYPWNGKVDIDCTLSGTAGTSYALTVNARDKVGGTNLTVRTVSVEGGSATGNPVSVTPGTYRLVWDADKDLPNGFRGEKISISVSVSEPAKKYMIVDLQSGAITYQANVPEGGWNQDEYKGAKMAFVRIEPGTFTQYSKANIAGREVSMTKPYYVGILPVTHMQLRNLSGATMNVSGTKVSFQDSLQFYYSKLADCDVKYAIYADQCYRGAVGVYFANNNPTQCGLQNSYQQYYWPLRGYHASEGSPIAVLRSRTGCAKFDLPTEAQMTYARDDVVWTSEDAYTLCLDVWRPWLGSEHVTNPLGDVPMIPDYRGTFYQDVYSTCISKTSRKSTADVTPYARFCLYEAD